MKLQGRLFSREMFDFKRAVRTQQILSKRLDLVRDKLGIRTIGGADCSYDLKNEKIGAQVIVCRFPDLKIVDSAKAVLDVSVPYIPGFLSFREAPAYIKSFQNLSIIPDVCLVDGNGIAHPRRMGVASYLGVVLNISTIGCAKSPVFPFDQPDKERGSCTIYKNDSHEEVGRCVRTQTGVKPIFISPGNHIDLETSVRMVLECSKFRIPEPLRYAHTKASAIFKNK